MVRLVADPDTAIRVQAYGDGTVRAMAVADGDWSKVDKSLTVVADPHGPVTMREVGGVVKLATPEASALVSLLDGTVRLRDNVGCIVLGETAPGSFRPATVDGRPFIATEQPFNRSTVAPDGTLSMMTGMTELWGRSPSDGGQAT